MIKSSLLFIFLILTLVADGQLKSDVVKTEAEAKVDELAKETTTTTEVEKEKSYKELEVLPLPSEDPPAILPIHSKKVDYRVRYPEYENARRNIMSPAPLPNNPQFYPFMMTIPMEGGDILPVKAMELSLTQHFLTGDASGKSTRYQIDVDQNYFEQNFSLSLGLPSQFEVGLSMPLYHFDGDNLMTQDGIAIIGPLGGTRNFWGALSLNLKHLYYEDKEKQVKGLLAAYFQFPEGNQRGRGGTSSGHWAINAIIEKQIEQYRLNLNLGLLQPGTLRLLNNQSLEQGMGWFLGASLAQKITPISAIELQLHLDQSGLKKTNISDLEDPHLSVGIGYRTQIKKSVDASIAAFTGVSSPIGPGLSLDLKYYW